MKSKILKGLTLTALAAMLTACGNLSNVSKEGTTDNPVFPKIADARFNHDGTQKGSWVNWNNVKQIEQGMNKDQIRLLIGDPQYGEGLYGVREWDYVFNYRENGEHKQCQYKVLFDKNMNVNQQWWLPNGCGAGSLAPYVLNGDFLFDFDKATLTPEGKEVVRAMANDIKASGARYVKVEGYTDRLGSVDYNMNLSQRRANTVKALMAETGVVAQIEAVGRGKANQVVACDGMSGKAEKDCLKPNRRVVVTAEGTTVQMENNVESKAGFDGPIKVREHKANTHKNSWDK